ncbi:MAG: hypothetical protein WAW00_01150 [Candidatus Moraniibacteriota bacterium]
MFGLSKRELAALQKLSTPERIQDFLDRLPINHEKHGDTCLSPRQVLRQKKALCIEGAMLAATALWLHGEKPLLLDLTTYRHQDDHVVALYRRNGYWGAISKTNHATLRFRDPIYETIRELALSYYHEYFAFDTGKKILKSYAVLSLRRFGTEWITAGEDVWHIAEALDAIPHRLCVPQKNRNLIRKVSALERKAARLVEWEKTHPRT